MRCILFVIIASASCLLIGGYNASAQEPGGDFEIREDAFPALWSGWFAFDRASFMPTLAKLMTEYEERVGGPCADHFSIDADINKPARGQFADSLRRSINADTVWRLEVFVEQCGRSTYSGFVFNSEDDTLAQIALFGPGKTVSDAQLQKDIATAIYTSLNTVVADRENCPAAKDQPMVFYDREVADGSRLSEPSPSWTERWAVPLCGKIIIFRIDNQINDRGAAYHIKEDGIVDPELFSVSTR